MTAITDLMETEENDKKNIRLNYLSETLANAISDMDETARNVKNYAMKNSFVAEDNFINQSLKLDKMRTMLAETKAFEKILGVLVESLEQDKTNSDHYQVLRVKYPLIDDVEFRRILGMSETVSAWTWPDFTTVKSVQITLSDRIQNLGTQIRLIENEAKLYAESAEKFMKLDRQSKVAEATYQILIEQVKSEALAAGFNPKSFRVIEYATTPISPSSPNLFLHQLLGSSLGFILSVTLALILGLARGVFYTRSYLKSFTPTRVQLRGLAKLRRLSNLSISKLHQKIDSAQLNILQEIEISINNEKIIYLHNSNTKSINFARALAEKSSLSNRKIALFDFVSSASQKENSSFGFKNIIAEPVSDNLDIFLANKDADVNYFFTDKDLDKKLNKVLENYDQIIICAKSKISFVGLYALKNLNPAIILLCKLKRTRKLDLVKLQNISSPAVLVHD